MITRLGRLAAALCATLCASVALAIEYSGPITITAGGTYTGNWRSDNPDTPAVRVQTTAPVTIVNSNIRSSGVGITNGGSGINLTVRNTMILGAHPGGDNRLPRRNVNVENAKNFVFENNHVEGGGGLHLLKFTGSGGTNETIRIRFNTFKNMEARRTVPGGLWSTASDTRTMTKHPAIQLNQVRGLANIDIAWNQIWNEPWISRTEDTISIYLSSGTSVSPIRIRNNFIFGAYAGNPIDDNFTGSGVMMDGSDDSVQTNNTAHVRIEDNQIIGTSNCAIGIPVGYEIKASGNRFLSSGRLDTGEWIKAQNVGIYIQNRESNQYFSGNYAENNAGGWLRIGATGSIINYPTWTPISPRSLVFGSNTTLYSPSTLTRAVELAEIDAWTTKLVNNNISLGVPGAVVRTLGANADSFVTAGSPDSASGGTAAGLLVKSQGSTMSLARKGYFRFSLSGYSGAQMQAAVLRLTLSQLQWASGDVSGGLRFHLYGLNVGSTAGGGRLGADWTESALTWNNAPANNSTGNSVNVGTGTSNGGQARFIQTVHVVHPRKENHLISFFGPELDAFLDTGRGGNVTFIVVRDGGSNDTNTAFASRENTGFAKPQLTFTTR
jgi:hypothetical protein